MNCVMAPYCWKFKTPTTIPPNTLKYYKNNDYQLKKVTMRMRNLYMHIDIRTCTYRYIDVYIIYIWISTGIFICEHTYIKIHSYLSLYVIYLCMNIYAYIYIHICILTYITTSAYNR
jgi:hypothetical protein